MPRMPHGLSRYDLLLKTHLKADTGDGSAQAQTLGRIFPPNPVKAQHLTNKDIIDSLALLANGMGSDQTSNGPAAAGMTFFGQFVDHDITLDATSALGTRISPATITNVRTPTLDLDCIYGSGPEASPHLYGTDQKKDNKGDTTNFLVYGRASAPYDLARTSNGTALIGDPRNDENAVVSQIQANMVALHNILMTEMLGSVATKDEIADTANKGMSHSDWEMNVPDHHRAFEEVRRYMRLHYQWAIWNELLPAFVDQAVLDNARRMQIFGPCAPMMPVEFTGAAYRFGHATAQPHYDLDATRKKVALSDILGFGKRDTPLDMSLFFDYEGKRTQSARPVGTSLGEDLLNLPFVKGDIELGEVGETLVHPRSANLPLRNMIRDRFTYQLASGEQVKEYLQDEAGLGMPDVSVPDALKSAGITKTPLWFYCLQEAKEHGHGKLTGVGGNLVASVFARLLQDDETTYWHADGFKPSAKFDKDGGVLAGMMQYAETHREKIKYRASLRNG